MIRVQVQAEPFDVGAAMGDLPGQGSGQGSGQGCGGIGCFVGIVRGGVLGGVRGGTELSALTLEHYPGMTERAITRIAEAASERFGLLGCTVIHRIGRLAVGEPIVLVLAAAAHRQAALDGTAFLIDWLKTRAPFWKCEEFVDGSRVWVESRQDDEHAAGRWDRARTA